jgi:energy-coupling factor transport system permease protein
MRAETSPGPLSLLAACLLPVAGAFAIVTAATGALAVGVELAVLGWLTSGGIDGVVRRLAFGCVAAAGIAVTTWLYGGHSVATAGGAALRIVYLVLPSALLASRIRPSSLGDALAQRLHLPARGVVAATAVLQRLESLGDQWQQIQRARRSRGLGLDGGPQRRVKGAAGSAFALLVVALRQAGTMAVAMDARGFAGANDRTWAEPAPWRRIDTFVVALAGGLGILPWILR